MNKKTRIIIIIIVLIIVFLFFNLHIIDRIKGRYCTIDNIEIKYEDSRSVNQMWGQMAYIVIDKNGAMFSYERQGFDKSFNIDRKYLLKFIKLVNRKFFRTKSDLGTDATDVSDSSITVTNKDTGYSYTIGGWGADSNEKFVEFTELLDKVVGGKEVIRNYKKTARNSILVVDEFFTFTKQEDIEVKYKFKREKDGIPVTIRMNKSYYDIFLDNEKVYSNSLKYFFPITSLLENSSDSLVFYYGLETDSEDRLITVKDLKERKRIYIWG